VESEATKGFSWRGRQAGNRHTECREGARVNRLDQPDQHIVENADLLLVKAIGAREKQPRYLSQNPDMAVRGAASKGSFKLGNKSFTIKSIHRRQPICSAGTASSWSDCTLKMLIYPVKLFFAGCVIPVVLL
jgi:hypothetical protein